MRAADDGRAGRARDVGEQRPERERVGGVEPCRRLVRHDHERARGQCAGQRGPLTLAGRELAHGPFGVLLEAHRGEGLGGPAGCLNGSDAAEPRARALRSPGLRGRGRALAVWPTNAIARRRSSARPARSSVPSETPSTRTSPSSGTSSPASRCRSVVLPEPDGPVTTVSFPGANVASSRSNGVADPYRFVSPRASIGLC